jgi:hypothetical protein
MEEDGSPPAHIYLVEPHSPPELDDPDEGHFTSGARVIRKVFDAETGKL